MSCVIFDLDGTLLDTIPSILNHVNETLGVHGLSPISYEECRAFIGHGARRLISCAFAARGVTEEAIVQSALARYNAAYDADPYVGTHPYDGVHELLRALEREGGRLCVVSNKPQPTVERLLSHFFDDVHFSVIVGGRDDLPLKPDPAVGHFVSEQLSIDLSQMTVVGDSDVDMHFARSLGVRGVGVSWGFRSVECLLDAGADVIAHRASQLGALLLRPGEQSASI